MILLLGLILMHLSIYCQNDYPQKAIIKGDTIALITPSQVTKINLTYNELDKCLQKNKSLSNLVTLYEDQQSTCDTIRNLLTEQKKNLQTQVTLSQEIIVGLNHNIKIQKRHKNIFASTTLGLLILFIFIR